MTERSRKLLRQFSKILKAEDAENRLATLSTLLAKSDAAAFTADIEMLGHFPEFFTSVEKSYEEYESQAKLAYHNLEKSSTELNDSNRLLEDLNTTFVAMLDTLGQGLFVFGQDGMCSNTFSKACLSLIECSPAGKSIAEVLASKTHSQHTIQSLLPVLFSGSESLVSIDDIFELFPNRFTHSQGLAVTLEYRPIKNFNGGLQSVLVIATNHTEEVSALAQAHEREQKALTILRIASNRNVFTNFFITANNYFTALEDNLSEHTTIEQVRRDIHTLKGNASIFHLQSFVDALHALETALDEAATIQQAREILLPASFDIQNHLFEIKMEARNVLGDDFDQQGAVRSIPLDQLKTFAMSLGQLDNAQELRAAFISSFMGEMIQKQMSPLAMGLQGLADRYGKTINPCEFIGENFPILSEHYQPLFDTFTHIIRNIVAHAIEDDETRANNGKPEALSVIVDTHKFKIEEQEWFRVSFTDDGRGIDVEALRKKLPTSVAETASESEVMQYIFVDNMSTKEHADELSGRGAGMSAIRQEARRLGGKAYVESAQGIFTRIVVEVPLVWG